MVKKTQDESPKDVERLTAAYLKPPLGSPPFSDFNFEDFVNHGIAECANLVDGVPWSWSFFGHPVTHENNDLYLVSGNEPNEQFRFARADMLRVWDDGDHRVEYFHGQYVNAGETIERADLIPTDAETEIAPKGNFDKIYGDHNDVEVYARTDEPRLGHDYIVALKDEGCLLGIEFQDGAIQEHGVNGVQNEHLIAVLIHRLKFLDSKFPCIQNAEALYSLKKALRHLEQRTELRLARGVEGKSVP